MNSLVFMNNNFKLNTNLDMDALRSFVKGIELGNFNRAAAYLCKSPAAISAQLKKLEQQTGSQLLRKHGRLLELTPNGELLLSHAKHILTINDNVLLKLNQSQESGIIRFGLQEDFAEGTLQQLIAQFMLQYPNVQFQIQVDRNHTLVEKVDKQELDLALVWKQSSVMENFDELKKADTEWLFCSHPHIQQILEKGSSIPLIVLQQPCILRDMAIQLLERNGLAWHIAYECNSVQALWPAIRAGIGIGLRSLVYIPSDIYILKEYDLPHLAALSCGLYISKDYGKAHTIHSFKKYIQENFI